jgi:hypothetical protein
MLKYTFPIYKYKIHNKPPSATKTFKMGNFYLLDL